MVTRPLLETTAIAAFEVVQAAALVTSRVVPSVSAAIAVICTTDVDIVVPVRVTLEMVADAADGDVGVLLLVHAVMMSKRITAARLPKRRGIFMRPYSAIEMPQLAPMTNTRV